MSMAWSTLETEILQALAALESEGAPLLATVKGRSSGDRKSLASAFLRERMPAAYVLSAGRTQRASDVMDTMQVAVWLATRSERGDDDARLGGADVTGMYPLAQEVLSALHDRVMPEDVRLRFVDEKALTGGDGALLWEQVYALDSAPRPAVPLFGGVALAGSSSRMRVEVGPLQRVATQFSFPGIDGVFERNLGTRERRIVWQGELRAEGAAALTALETAVEDELAKAQAKTVVDEWGRAFDACVLRSYARKGPRRVDARSGGVIQEAVLEFAQLHGVV